MRCVVRVVGRGAGAIVRRVSVLCDGGGAVKAEAGGGRLD